MNSCLTMGENLADLGGLSSACQALQKRLGHELSNDTSAVFFKSWANIYKAKATKAHIIEGLATDTHAPPSFRANLVRNIDAFYDAFDIQPGDPMYLPPEK